MVPGRESLVPARVKAFLKLQARLALQEAVDDYSQRLGRPYGRLTCGTPPRDGGLVRHREI